MKKQFKFYALCLAVSFGLAACGDDDDNNGNGNGNGNTTPPPSEVGIQAQVSSYDSYDLGTASFKYDGEGRMTGGVSGGGETFAFSFNPLGITSQYKYDDEIESESANMHTANLKTNGQGFLTSADFITDYENQYSGETETWKTTETLSCTYTNDGYLAEAIVYTVWDDDEEDEETTYTYTWQDGNLVSLTCNWRSKLEDGSWYDDGGYTLNYTYGEGAVDNSGVYIGDMMEEIGDYLFYSGLLGKMPKQIPTAVSSDLSGYTENLTVTTDEKGRITLIMSSDGEYSSNTCAYAYDGQTAQLPEPDYSVAKARKHFPGATRRHHRDEAR